MQGVCPGAGCLGTSEVFLGVLSQRHLRDAECFQTLRSAYIPSLDGAGIGNERRFALFWEV